MQLPAKPATSTAEPKTTTLEELVAQSPSLLDQIIAKQAEISSRYMPVMDVATAVKRISQIKELKEMVLIEAPEGTADGDYGVIPGTKKPTLLKPGAEKICSFFGYVPHYEIMEGSIEDWRREQSGEPLFYYHVRCILLKDGMPVGEGTGSCNSWESKYRYRSADRLCPVCGKATIIKGKDEYGGGWLCYGKKGGCGAKFADGDAAIEGQPTGQVVNDKIFDIINTVQKIADKRSLIAAVLAATGASQWFTQDMEDFQTAGSKEAQDAVKAEKLASLEYEQRQKEKANGGAKPAETKALDAPKTTPPAAGLFGADASDPEPLKNTMKAFTQGNLTLKLAMFAQLRQAIKAQTGTEDIYYDCLKPFAVSHSNELKELGKQQKAVRSVWIALANVMQGDAQ